MVPRPSDRGTERVRARRKAAQELARLRRGYTVADDRRKKRVVNPSPLVDASAVIIRLRPYRHLLGGYWGWFVDEIVDLLIDEYPDEVARWILEEADVA
jgi:hypothetical protein